MKSRDDRSDARISGPKPMASSAARRVEAIIEGAERAAERVIDDAEAKAREYLAEAKAAADRTVAERLAALSELTDALVVQADAIRRQSELLTTSLREAKDRLEAETDAGPAPPGEKLTGEEGAELAEVPSAPRLAAVEPAEPQPPEDQAKPEEVAADQMAERRKRGSPAGARLLATQMAVSGSSREEIAARLRTGFEIDDTDAILDAILGPEA